MKRKVSLKDIAQKVGVSITLVSYVLNNKQLNRISTHIAQKIKETAAELNYKPNQVAKGLKTNKTQTIGLLVADISNPFSSTMARIIENEAEKYNYTVIFGSSDENPDRSKKLMDVLINHQVDGLIIAPAEHSEKQLQYLVTDEIPFVLIDRFYADLACCHISLDNFEAGKKLANHLIENGCRRIGLITYRTTLNNIKERKLGYFDALKEHGLEADKNLVKEVSSPIVGNEIAAAIKELLTMPSPVDSILFTANLLSLHGLKYINTLPVKVPDDLAIGTFDESEAADLFYAPLTHIKQPLKEMGRLAVQTLMDLIEEKKGLVQLELKGELVIRKSSLAAHPES